MSGVLHPGARHPYAAMTPAVLARFVHVPLVEVFHWIDEGLPLTTDRRIDPFVCSNWLCAGRLDRCPALARRWRTYLLFFAPFLAGQDRVRRVRWLRSQRLYLPERPHHLDWWLARAVTTATQVVEAEQAPELAEATTTAETGWWRLSGAVTSPEPSTTASTDLNVTPTQMLSPGEAEHTTLAAYMEELVAEFRYEYRHHQPGDYRTAFVEGRVDEPRVVGSCLDAALALAARLTQHGRPSRVVAGVVADSRIANPHFWLEVETTAGWAPLDPTLPAIVRMVGGDWRAAVRAWTGACDARRVTLGIVGAGIGSIPGGATCGSLMGEAVVDGQNAWPCLDWVCGDCEAEFNERR